MKPQPIVSRAIYHLAPAYFSNLIIFPFSPQFLHSSQTSLISLLIHAQLVPISKHHIPVMPLYPAQKALLQLPARSQEQFPSVIYINLFCFLSEQITIWDELKEQFHYRGFRYWQSKSGPKKSTFFLPAPYPTTYNEPGNRRELQTRTANINIKIKEHLPQPPQKGEPAKMANIYLILLCIKCKD